MSVLSKILSKPGKAAWPSPSSISDTYMHACIHVIMHVSLDKTMYFSQCLSTALRVSPLVPFIKLWGEVMCEPHVLSPPNI